MPKSFTGYGLKDIYKDILHTNNSNTGLSSSLKQITCGDGDDTPLYLSQDKLSVTPSSDSTGVVVIYDADGNALLTVDSNNDVVKAGIGQQNVNTNYAYFGIDSGNSSAASTDEHYAIGFNGLAPQTKLTFGSATDPSTTLTISSNADDVACCMWYVHDNIKIDSVVWFSGGDASGGDVSRAHLTSYDIDTGNGSTGGDLTNGTAIYEGSNITNLGYEQLYYQQMTLVSGQSGNVNGGKVMFFTHQTDSVSSDYSINATIKYHLR